MTPKNGRRWLTSFLLLALLGPSIAAGGPWWWEKHFEGDEYSRLHYWAPGLYTWRAYRRPVTFDTPAEPYPPTPVGAKPYPFRPVDSAPVIPVPSELKKDALPIVPPGGNGLVEPIGPPARQLPIK